MKLFPTAAANESPQHRHHNATRQLNVLEELNLSYDRIGDDKVYYIYDVAENDYSVEHIKYELFASVKLLLKMLVVQCERPKVDLAFELSPLGHPMFVKHH